MKPEGKLGTEKDIVGHRIFAAIIDTIILGFIETAILGGTLALKSVESIIVAFSTTLLIWVAYGIILETWRGQTIGKLIMGIMVIKPNGAPCDFMSAFVRNVLRVVDGLGYWLVGFIAMALTDKRQRIGDVLANTVVVKVKK